MAIFEEHKYEKKYLERLHNPKTAHKAITPHMAKQKRTSEPQPDSKSHAKKQALAKKIKYEKGDDRHPDSIAYHKRELENPRYPKSWK